MDNKWYWRIRAIKILYYRIKNILCKPSYEQMYKFCKDHYYCADDSPWQPFENWQEDDIEECIQSDVAALRTFLNGQYR